MSLRAVVFSCIAPIALAGMVLRHANLHDAQAAVAPLWPAALVSTAAVSIWYVTVLSRLPAFLILSCTALTALYLPITRLDDATPFMLCAMTGGAYYLERSRFESAAMCLAFTMLEPHLGGVVCAAAFAGFPRLRTPLVAATLLLSVVAFFVMGSPHISAPYDALTQHSVLSAVSYAALGAAAFAVGHRAAARLDCKALIILLPAAIVLLNPWFKNETMFALALPGALVLAGRARNCRGLSWLALGALVFPWTSLTNTNVAILLSSFGVALGAAAAIAYIATAGLSTFSRLVTAAGAVLACGALLIAFRHLPDPWLQIELERLPNRCGLIILLSAAWLQRRADPSNDSRVLEPTPGVRISTITLPVSCEVGGSKTRQF